MRNNGETKKTQQSRYKLSKRMQRANIDKSRRYEKVASIDPLKYSVDSPISRSEAVRVIAQIIDPPNGDQNRGVRDRISHLITYSTKTKGELPDSDSFVFGDVIRWAKSKWEGKFNHLPASPCVAKVAILNSTLPSLSGSMRAISLPGNLDQCHTDLIQLHRRIGELEAELAIVQSENEVLSRDADRWRQTIARRRSDGSKGGRGKAK